MATRMRIRKGDLVQILSGKDRGKQGRVIDARPKDGKVDRREPQHRQAAHEAAADRRTRAAWAARR